MSDSLLIAGHTLVNEGAAFLYPDCPECAAEEFPRRTGHGQCACAARSPHLPSTAQRKRWHRDHKHEVLTSRSGVNHTCPDARRTGRAAQVERLVEVIGRARSNAKRSRDDFDALADHLMHMRMHRLCYACGYPLDNSAPHPVAAPVGKYPIMAGKGSKKSVKSLVATG